MTKDRRKLRALADLLPAGALGLSISLASADASAKTSDGVDRPAPVSVALRLQSIRNSVSEVLDQAAKDPDDPAADRETQLAWWGNGGWRNGGWRNGGWGNGWHNGGWGNGWHNGGWGNGLLSPLLGPWGNGWHNW
jgi:rSAM-associated Gly-rich repeat protein